MSLAKAKKERIKVAKLPLDHLKWGCGSGKSLTLNQVIGILLDVRHTNDWMKSLTHVPPRKLRQSGENKGNKQISFRSKMIDTLMQKQR